MYSLDYDYMGFSRCIRKIKGQTYQNLLSETKTLGKFVYNDITGEYTLTNPTVGAWNTLGISYTRPIQAGEKLLIRINIVKNTIESTQSPPLKITFSNSIQHNTGCININSGVTGLIEHYCNGASINDEYKSKIEIATRSYSSGELVIKDIQVIPVSENPIGSTELPTSINGIESACENENNVLLLKDNSIQLPQPLRSLPNGVCDELKGNTLTKNIYELKLDNNFNFAVSVTLGSVLTDSTLFRFDIKLKYSSPTGDINSIISNKFPYLFIHGLNGGASKVTQECVSNHSANKGMVSVIIKKSRLTSDSVDGFKEWCIANNFKILYQLETPIEHTLDISIKKIRKNTKCYNAIKPIII